jgi:hypothetical protein
MISLPDIEKHEDSTRVADHAVIMESRPFRTGLRLLLNRHRKD